MDLKNTPIKKYTLVFIIAVVILVAGGLLIAHNINKARYKQAIETVLEQDKKAARGVERSASTLWVIPQRMRNIDLSECPEDFRTAYRKHIEAWDKTVPLCRRIEDFSGWGNKLKAFLAGLAAGLTGRHELVASNFLENLSENESIKQEARKIEDEIKTTWITVVEVANSYGAIGQK